MANLFMSTLKLSVTASYGVLFILVIRLLLKKSPKKYSYFLWFIVLFKLIYPFTFETPFSIMPKNNMHIYTLEDFVTSIPRPIDTDITVAPINPIDMIPFTHFISIIWFIVVIILLACSLLKLKLFKKSLNEVYDSKNNTYTSDKIITAFVLGVLRPKIYIPHNLKKHEKDYIIEHEIFHIKRYDHIVKPIFFFLVCIHWFNPLILIAYHQMIKDMEMSCDESVISKLGNTIKKDYSNSLLAFAVNEQSTINKLAFGNNDVKKRIKNILTYKKPKKVLIVLSSIFIIFIIFITLGEVMTPIVTPLKYASSTTPRNIEIIDSKINNSLNLTIEHTNFKTLPDYNYSGTNIYEKIVTEAALARFEKYYAGQFNIVDTHIFDVYEEKNKIKIFANIHATGFILAEGIVYPQSGFSIPTAITCLKNEDGSYTIEKYEEPSDGDFYASSIKKFCKMPISEQKISGLANEMIKFTLYDTEELNSLELKLKEHLLKHGHTNIFYLKDQYPDDNYIEIT
ncbi:MAG: M56 family metallopeptidase [Sarcina sp.]